MNVVPVTLDGEFVRLEPLDLDRHFQGLCEVGLHPDLWRWTVAAIRTPDDLRGYLETAIREREEGRSLPFATISRATDMPIGSTRFGNIDRENRRVEIGWTWLGRDWWRTAANTEAKLLMLTHAFETWRVQRVELKTDAMNERSRAAILRIGAKEEGIFRKHMVTETGRRRDSAYYSIIDDEWPAVKTGLIEKLAAHRADAQRGV